MVNRFFKLLSKEIGGLHEAAYLLGAFAIVSQLLALGRDRLLAHTFGASNTLDIYYAAFRIPDFIFVSIASIVSISVLIPFLMERMDQGEHEAKEFIDGVFSAFFLIISVAAIGAFVAAPWLIRLFFPTLAESGDYSTLVSMTRIMLLSPIFLGFSNFFASITQIYKRFFIYALSPVVYNIGIIIGIVFLYPVIGLPGLAWGVAIGAFLHCFIQLPFVWHTSLFPRLSFNFKGDPVRRVILISFPRTITVSSNEIAEFFLITLAATLGSGAISIFNFSWNLQSVPLTVIGVSYSLATFPVLTRFFTSGDSAKFFEQMIVSAKHIIFWSVPVMTLFIVLRAQIVRVILGTGRFDWPDTRLTAAALALFIFSLVPQSLVALFVRSYYSRSNTKKPLLMDVFSAGLIIVLSFGLLIIFNTVPFFRYFIESLFRVSDVTGTAMLMLPLGFSIGVTVNMLIHWIAFERDFPGYTSATMRPIFEILSASIIMGFVSYLYLGVFSHLFDLNTFWGIFLQGFLAGIIGIFVVIGLLILLNNKELKDVAEAFKHKFWKASIVPSDPSGV